MRIVLALILLAMTISTVSLAAAPESRFTSIANKDCRFDPISDEVGGADDQQKTCAGPDGIMVLVNAYETRVRIGFRWPKGRGSGEPVWAVEAWSAGFVIDWRGTKGANGFVPYAATVRMKFAKDYGAEVGDQVLAVIRIADGEACLMGAVDARANRNANELARTIADTATSFVCGKDRPKIGGITTPAATTIAAGVTER